MINQATLQHFYKYKEKMRTKLHLIEEMFQIEEDIIKTNKIFDK